EEAGAGPARPAGAQAAGALRGAHGATEAGGRARDVPAAGERGRDGGRTQPDVPGREEASGSVPAAGGGHRARVADGVPERPRAEALAVQAAERLTDT